MHQDIPRPDDSDDGLLSENAMKFIVGLVADNLEAAQEELAKLQTGYAKENIAHATVAQAFSQQAQSLSLYILMCAGLER